MSFEHDVMISYSWRDNQPPPMSKQEGWVSAFQEGLEFWLKQIMPRPSKIWRDKNNLDGNKLWMDELEEIMGKCAVLLAVISEPYLSSEWCEKELKAFIQNAESQGGMRVDNDYRVFKINKLPVDRHVIPDELKVISGFDFYEIDPETRMPVPIDPSFGEAEREQFIKKVYSVSAALARILKQIEEKGLGRHGKEALKAKLAKSITDVVEHGKSLEDVSLEISIALAGTKVFIPYTTRDLRTVRDELVDELVRRNCIIYPQGEGLYTDVAEFQKAVCDDLVQCDLAIHIVGARYGMVLDGTTQSVAELQIDWAAAESKSRGLRRLIWLPKDLGNLTGLQAKFIERLRKDRMALEGADLMQDSMEVLKRQVVEMLTAKPEKLNAERGLQIYLLHEESDKEDVRVLRKFLKDKAVFKDPLRIILPIFDGDAQQTREMDMQNLCDCDAVILFWSSGSQAWLESALNELRKAPASGRTKPYLAKHLVYLTGQETSAKEDWWLDFQDGLLDEDVDTIHAIGKSPQETLPVYLKSLGQP